MTHLLPLLTLGLVLSLLGRPLVAEAKGGTTCVACGLIAGLLFEKKSADGKPLSPFDIVCGGGNNTACREELESALSYSTSADPFLSAKTAVSIADLASPLLNPDSLCALIGICDSSCKLFPDKWPVTPPSAPPKDPVNKDGERLVDQDDLDAKRLRTGLQRLLRMEHGGIVEKLSVETNVQIGTADNDFHALTSTLVHVLSPRGASLYSSAEKKARATIEHLSDDHPCPKGNNTLKCLLDRFLNEHRPISDLDGDAFAPVRDRGLRGSHWRGADCSDADSSIYPGRRDASRHNESVDHDCNGIFGSDPGSGQSYEEKFCKDTQRRGLIHIGDSATAHFHLPPQWLSKNGWGLRNLIPDAEDELDQPACAWGTGYRNASECPFAPAKLKDGMSIAERLRNRNRCNHRDFQNVGVNGARSTASMALVESAARDATLDHPALVIFSLIGNDVCNGHPGTTHMTEPDVFEKNVRAQLSALDSKLPSGSAVVAVGLVDGRVLWNNMHARQHPIGATYEEVYGYLNCNTCNPCHGWLNSNETLRNATTDWAHSLNAVYRKIQSETRKGPSIFKNFEFAFFDPDWAQLINQYVQSGGNAGDCIEPSDGFHPSQTGNELFASQLWSFFENEFPAAIGEVNPHNDDIQNIFGDQGGF